MVNKITTNAIGAAGVLRIMSELILRGHNPSVGSFDDGTDIFIENIKIQVKTARKINRKERSESCYYFNLNTNRYRKGKTYEVKNTKADFFIFYGIDDSVFLIVPRKEVEKFGVQHLSIAMVPKTKKIHQFMKYKDKWELLN